MANFLLIPHSSALNVRVRSFEIAKALSAHGHGVHYWHYDSSDRTGPLALPRIAASELLRADEIFPFYGVNILRTSRLYKPQYLAQAWNNRQLARIVKKYKVNYIISASFSNYTPPAIPGVTYIFDCVDDTVGYPDLLPAERIRRLAIMKHQVAISDRIIASSSSIKRKLLTDYGASHDKMIFIPNGVNVSDYQNVETETMERFRQRHGLPAGKRIASFIGNHAKWTGIDFVHELFSRDDPRLENWILVLAGPIYRRMESAQRVYNLGTISWAAVPDLIGISDCGLLPFELSDFTSNALPIKVLEYSAVGKPILATRLAEVASLNWPNITLRDATLDAWADELVQLNSKTYQVEGIEAYDWMTLARNLLDELFLQ